MQSLRANPRDGADAVMTDKLGLSSSLLLGNPIPAEYHAVGEELQKAVDRAVAESVENGMARSGKQVTPWLLQRVAELSEGRSLASSESFDDGSLSGSGTDGPVLPSFQTRR